MLPICIRFRAALTSGSDPFCVVLGLSSGCNASQSTNPLSISVLVATDPRSGPSTVWQTGMHMAKSTWIAPPHPPIDCHPRRDGSGHVRVASEALQWRRHSARRNNSKARKPGVNREQLRYDSCNLLLIALPEPVAPRLELLRPCVVRCHRLRTPP